MDIIEPHFRSVTECPPEIETKVIGDLPNWLNGSLIRIGPGKWDLKDDFTLKHWLDGCAILIKFRFENGKVFFSSRFLESDAYRKMISLGRPVYTEFGTRAYPDSTKNVISRMIAKIVPSDLTDNDISNIYVLNDEVFTATESCNIWRIEAQNLTAVEKLNLDKIVGVNLSTSHPLYSKSDGFYYNIGTNFLAGMKYHIYRVPKRGEVMSSNKEKTSAFKGAGIIATISSSWKTCFSYVHSFAMSENYIVLIEQPLVVNGFKLATCTAKGKSMEECLEWRPEDAATFHLIEKSSGKVSKLKYFSEAFFFFHTINAHEQDGFIIVDIIAYEDVKVLEKYHIQALRRNEFSEECPPVARRYVLPLESKLVHDKSENLVDLPNCTATASKRDNAIWLTWEQLAQPGFEIPTFNGAYASQKYRYIYGSGTFEKGFFAHSVCKLDLETRNVKLWKDSTETTFPGEAFFLPKPGGTSEDDGVVLSAVLESNEDKQSFLVILDARNMQEMARAFVPSPEGKIPPTIHGIFINP